MQLSLSSYPPGVVESGRLATHVLICALGYREKEERGCVVVGLHLGRSTRRPLRGAAFGPLERNGCLQGDWMVRRDGDVV